MDDTAADSVPPCERVASGDALEVGEVDGIAVPDEVTLTTGVVLEDDDGLRLVEGECVADGKLVGEREESCVGEAEGDNAELSEGCSDALDDGESLP